MISETIILDAERPYVTLTSFIINNSNDLGDLGPRPAVIICPGGGYMNLSNNEAEPVALMFASMGYHAFVLNYSTYDKGTNEFPDISSLIPAQEETMHPAPVRDVARAMLLIRENALEWKVDTDRIAVCGFSAGGHNAAMYGVYWNDPVITEYFNVDAEALRPAALILGYAVLDYAYMDRKAKKEIDDMYYTNSTIALTGKAHLTDEELNYFSVNKHVSEATPPTFLWATAGDDFVPATNSLNFAAALAANNIPYALHIFEKGPHGMALAKPASSLAKSMMNANTAHWTELLEEWLSERFAMKIPRRTPFEMMREE